VTTPPEIGYTARRGARRAAQRLRPELGATLVLDVETVLAQQGSDEASQYLDPVGLAALIVASADLAWTVFNDLRQRSERADKKIVERLVLGELVRRQTAEPEQLQLVVEVVVDETVPPQDDSDSAEPPADEA
jgi:hypothetical protein